FVFFFFSSRRRHTRSKRDWSSDVCSSDLSQRHSHITQPAISIHAPRGGSDIIEIRKRLTRPISIHAPRGGSDSCFIQIAFRRISDRKSTRLNSSHVSISYAVFCLNKK